jgi:hypothetical protein
MVSASTPSRSSAILIPPQLDVEVSHKGAEARPAIARSVAEAHGYTAAQMVLTAIVISSIIAFALSAFRPASVLRSGTERIFELNVGNIT